MNRTISMTTAHGITLDLRRYTDNLPDLNGIEVPTVEVVVGDAYTFSLNAGDLYHLSTLFLLLTEPSKCTP